MYLAWEAMNRLIPDVFIGKQRHLLETIELNFSVRHYGVRICDINDSYIPNILHAYPSESLGPSCPCGFVCSLSDYQHGYASPRSK